MLKKIDRKNRFVSMFDPKTGFYARSGVIDENGKDTGVDPFMTSYPELIDVGVMGHCVHGASGLCLKSGVQCYQNGLKTHHPNMSLENFKRIVDECKGKTFQLALGGRGDVDQHENFAEILQYCRENNIVPNFTSSGLGFTNLFPYAKSIAAQWQFPGIVSRTQSEPSRCCLMQESKQIFIMSLVRILLMRPLSG